MSTDQAWIHRPRARALTASLLLALAMAGSPVSSQSAGQGPIVPASHVLFDLIADHGFESSLGGFEPVSPSDGSVALTAANPISGAQSLLVAVSPARADRAGGRRAGRLPG